MTLFKTFLFALACCSLWGQTTWTLDPAKLQTELPRDVSSQELVDILKVHGIDVVFQENSQESAQPLWQGKCASVFLAKNPQTSYHLWVEASGRRSLEECSPEDVQELYQACWAARKALTEVFGASGFMIFQVDSFRAGKTSSSYGFELLPAMHKDRIDTVEKEHLNEYMYHGEPTYFTVSKPAAEQTAALKESLAKHFLEYQAAIGQNTKGEPLPQEAWTQNMVNKSACQELIIGHIYNRLKNSGILTAGQVPAFPPDAGVEPLKINNDACAFCNPAVIKKQLVVETDTLYLLHSHKPLSDQGCFLLFPKRHMFSWDMNSQEIFESFRLIQSLKPKLESKLSGRETILYVQDGHCCGQTVPHITFHLLGIPSPMRHEVTGLQHNMNLRKVLPADKLTETCNAWAEELAPLR